MKNRKSELNVDFIGEQGRVITVEEEQAISDFIKADKAKRKAKEERAARKTTHRPKQPA